jgi:hypothetical protein
MPWRPLSKKAAVTAGHHLASAIDREARSAPRSYPTIAAFATSQRARPEVMPACRGFRLPGVRRLADVVNRAVSYFLPVLLRPAARRARFRRVGEIAVCSGTLWADKWDEK